MADAPLDPIKQAQLERWYNEYGRLVASIIHQRFSKKEDVEDLTQEVFERASRRLKDPSGEPIRSPKKWLVKVAESVCVDFLKKQTSSFNLTYIGSSRYSSDLEGSSPLFELPDTEGNQPEQRAERQELVEEGLKVLPLEIRDAVRLHGYGWTYQQIAAQSGRAEVTVGKDVRKGRELLRQYWSNREGKELL
jgi:RNA polymerase sigma factor (sigma-70 family)